MNIIFHILANMFFVSCAPVSCDIENAAIKSNLKTIALFFA